MVRAGARARPGGFVERMDAEMPWHATTDRGHTIFFIEMVPRVLSVILSTTPPARALVLPLSSVVPLRDQEALGSSRCCAGRAGRPVLEARVRRWAPCVTAPYEPRRVCIRYIF